MENRAAATFAARPRDYRGDDSAGDCARPDFFGSAGHGRAGLSNELCI